MVLGNLAEGVMVRAGLSLARVVAEGADLADSAGLEAVSVSALARRLGVRAPSLYTYVDGNAVLRLRITALALAESAHLAEGAMAGSDGVEALASYAETWRSYARLHPGRYAATRVPVPVDDESAAASSAVAAGRRHADLARAALAHRSLDTDGEVHATRLLGSLIHGYVSLELAGAFAHSEPASEESWRVLVGQLDAILAAGVGPMPPTGRRPATGRR